MIAEKNKDKTFFKEYGIFCRKLKWSRALENYFLFYWEYFYHFIGGRSMSLKTHSISKADYNITIQWLEARLAEMGATQKEIYTGELLLEESFFRLVNAAGDQDNFEGKITIRKRFGDISIGVSARGEAYNPFVAMEENFDDEEEMYVYALLKAHKESLSYSRSNGENVISIRVHSSSSKKAIHIMVGLVTGLVLGCILKLVLDEGMLHWLESIILTPIQSMFIQALMMLAAPLIFFSIMSGVTGMSNAADIGKMGGKLMGVSIIKLAMALLMGSAVGLWIGAIPEMANFLQNIDNEQFKTISLVELLVDIVPRNVVVPFASNNMLQVLFMALFFGILLAKAGDRAAKAKEVVDFCNRFTMDAMGVLMPIMPFVVAVSMTKMMLHTDFSMLLAYGKIILGGYFLFPLVILLSTLFVSVGGRISPIPFLKKLLPYLVIPFSLSNSSACMPETIKLCREKLGIDEKVTMFAIPVGVQFNMTGSGAYLIMVALIMRMTCGLPVDMGFLVSFFVGTLLLTFTFPTVPGAMIVVMASVFAMAGIPTSMVMLFIGIDPIVDCIRTAGNVAGDISSAFVMARLDDKVDKEIYVK